MRKSSIILVVLLLSSFSVKAQYFDFSEDCKNAYLNISALEFDKGMALIDKERNQNPGNVLPILYLNYLDFLKVVIGEQENDYDEFRDTKRKRLRLIRTGDKDSPYYLYSLANLNLQYAFARLRFKDYFSALFEIKRAFHLLERNVEKYPEFLPNYIGFGLLHTMVGSIPKNYKWVSWLASMDGTVEQGYKELFMVLEKGQNNPEYSHLMNEAAFFLTFLEMNISADRAQAEKLLLLLNKEPNKQPLIVFAKLSILKRTSRNEEAIKILDEYHQSDSSYPFHYLIYLHGLLNLNKLDQKANTYFQKYLNEFKGGSYIKSSYQKMAWLALINGNIDEYQRLINFCKTKGNDYLGSDDHAEKEAENKEIPNVDLLKARLLYDGGYYEKSLSELAKLNLNSANFNKTETTEYYYRIARNYQGLEKFEQAIQFYKKAIETGQNLSAYFAGNSAMQLGVIYENKMMLDTAAIYYQTCLDLDFKTYKKSLDVKAKAALNRVQTKKGAK